MTLASNPRLSKDAPVRSRAYLDWIRSLPCCACRRMPPSEASHHPRRGHGSVGAKTCDLRTLPLCSECHREWHQRGCLGLMDGTQTREWVEAALVDVLRQWVRERL